MGLWGVTLNIDLEDWGREYSFAHGCSLIKRMTGLIYLGTRVYSITVGFNIIVPERGPFLLRTPMVNYYIEYQIFLERSFRWKCVCRAVLVSLSRIDAKAGDNRLSPSCVPMLIQILLQRQAWISKVVHQYEHRPLHKLGMTIFCHWPLRQLGVTCDCSVET